MLTCSSDWKVLVAAAQLVDQHGNEAADRGGIGPQGVERDGVEAGELGLGLLELRRRDHLGAAHEPRLLGDQRHEAVENAADVGAEKLGVGAGEDPPRGQRQGSSDRGSWAVLSSGSSTTCSGASVAAGSALMPLLQGEDVAIDAVGDADAAGLGDRAGIFLDEHAAPGAAGLALAERAVLAEAGEHLADHGLEEHQLEVLGPRRVLWPGRVPGRADLPVSGAARMRPLPAA